MTVPLSLKLKLAKFATGAPLKSLTKNQKKDLKKYSQENFRFSVDTDCNDCMSQALDKMLKKERRG